MLGHPGIAAAKEESEGGKAHLWGISLKWGCCCCSPRRRDTDQQGGVEQWMVEEKRRGHGVLEGHNPFKWGQTLSQSFSYEITLPVSFKYPFPPSSLLLSAAGKNLQIISEQRKRLFSLSERRSRGDLITVHKSRQRKKTPVSKELFNLSEKARTRTNGWEMKSDKCK